VTTVGEGACKWKAETDGRSKGNRDTNRNKRGMERQVLDVVAMDDEKLDLYFCWKK